MKIRLFAPWGLIGALALVAGGICAQTGSSMPDRSHGKMGRMHFPFGHGLHPSQGHGAIIGNKNTKVYHLAGERGALPAEKNRVYFSTEAQARAAGYHAAKQSMGGRRSPGSFGSGQGAHRRHSRPGEAPGPAGGLQH